MYYPIGAGDLYRVTSSDTVWPNPLKGEGAYYLPKEGNRYNLVDQLTVYCAEDPLVAISEGAFYQGMQWQHDIAYSRMKAMTYPLLSEHRFWAFQIDPLPAVLDLENDAAGLLFRYRTVRL